MPLTKVVTDRSGVIDIATMKIWFERIVIESSMQIQLPLTPSTDATLYKDRDTRAAFFGFAIGLRHAERIENQGRPVNTFTSPE